MSLQVESLALGPIETNCYIVTSDGHTMIIDPAFDAERIKVVLAGRVPEIIAITHRHWDHIQAVADIQKMTGAEIIADAEDADAVCDPAQSGSSEHDLDPNISVIERRLKDGDEVKLGQACFEVLHTPGQIGRASCRERV